MLHKLIIFDLFLFCKFINNLVYPEIDEEISNLCKHIQNEIYHLIFHQLTICCFNIPIYSNIQP